MFELQMWDRQWHTLWQSHENEAPIEALSRLIRFLGNLRNMQLFPVDTRYRVIFLKIILA